MLNKVRKPDRQGREAMYYAGRQDFAYRHGAYDYLESVAMAPRMATLAAYLRSVGVRRVLDVGCGTGHLLTYLPPEIGYLGVDVAATAVERGRERFADRPDTAFFAADFRSWQCPAEVDAVVWAGIGATWTLRGRGGNFDDWSSILDLAERHLTADGVLAFELVSQHWPALEKLVQGRYQYLTGCDVDCIQSEESPRRSIRLFRRGESRGVPAETRKLHRPDPRPLAPAPLPAATAAGAGENAEPPVTVSIPYYRCRKHLRRAVESVLAQSYRNLTLVVVNDGDPHPPWDLLEDLDDPRLVRFDLAENRGRYFADAVVLAATSDPYLLIQDADDWSEPDRLERLLAAVRDGAAAGAVSDFLWHGEDGTPGRRGSAGEPAEPAAEFRHRHPHHGLFATAALRAIGGYYGGFRLGYDSLITSLLPMVGELVAVREPLYHRRSRPESLTHSTETGRGSAARRQAAGELRGIYRQAWELYRRRRAGELDHRQLAAGLCEQIAARLTAADAEALRLAADRLRPLLASRRQPVTTAPPVATALPATAVTPAADVGAPSPPALFPLTLPDVRELIDRTHPMGQGCDRAAGHLGFGYLYHALVRTFRPEVVVSIGSYRGFSAVCLAVGVAENGCGRCLFIDPGKVDRHWHDPENVELLRRRYGLGDRFRHLRQTSQEALAAGAVPESIDLLLIDGDHSYRGVKYDFDHLGRRVPPGGLILLHDSTREGRGFTPWEVKAFLAAEVHGRPEYEALTLPLDAGLTVVRRRR